jgi:hypothetical protein
VFLSEGMKLIGIVTNLDKILVYRGTLYFVLVSPERWLRRFDALAECGSV